jgi:hypothetical protein
MLTSADFMFTPSDFAKVTRAPEFVLTLAFAATLFAYVLASALG